MNELPKGWEWATVEELGARTANALAIGPFGSNLKVADYRSSGVPLIFVRHIRARDFGGLDPKFIDAAKGEELSAHLVRPGDVVVTKMGEPPGDATVYRGRSAAVLTADCIKLTPHEAISADLLAYFIEAPQFRAGVRSITQGVAQKKVSLGRFRRLTIPVAPAGEQKRIVAVMEEYRSSLDAGERGLGRLPDRLEKFRQVLLREAFDPEWERASITAVTDPERVIRYGILKPGDDAPGGVPVVKVRDYPAGEIRTGSLKRTSREIADRFKGATLRPGDVLISIRGTYGRVAPVPDDLDGANITQDSARIAPTQAVHRPFLVHFLRSPECQAYLRRVARGVAVKGVNIRDLRELRVPVPDLEIQVRTAAVLDDQLALHARMSREVERSQRAAGGLHRSVLAAAFSGQLVPQDPDDEPASVLLARIRAERAANRPTKRNRKAKAS